MTIPWLEASRRPNERSESSQLPAEDQPKHRDAVGGKFVLSLDFELLWGVRDILTIAQYGQNILGVRQVIPRLLEVLERYRARATFATVGFLFHGNKTALIDGFPKLKPSYANSALSPYEHLDEVGADENTDPYHFGLTLLDQIGRSGQEIGCHTFSHYYCLEKGQTRDQFREDLRAARRAAEARGVQLNSLVFPRNQCNDAYLAVCHDEGIRSYRGNEDAWMTAPKPSGEDGPKRRAMRLMDAYCNLTGLHTFELTRVPGRPLNIPSSRFLRPYHPRLRLLEGLRLRRILAGMRDAAARGRVYHLWWHPHNFGVNLEENLRFLEKILRTYQHLAREFGFRSVTMEEAERETPE